MRERFGFFYASVNGTNYIFSCIWKQVRITFLKTSLANHGPEMSWFDSGCAFVIWTTWPLKCIWGGGAYTPFISPNSQSLRTELRFQLICLAAATLRCASVCFHTECRISAFWRVQFKQRSKYRKVTSIRQAPVFRHLRALRKSPWKFIIWMNELLLHCL